MINVVGQSNATIHRLYILHVASRPYTGEYRVPLTKCASLR
jgi:hypothetical protein